MRFVVFEICSKRINLFKESNFASFTMINIGKLKSLYQN